MSYKSCEEIGQFWYELTQLYPIALRYKASPTKFALKDLTSIQQIRVDKLTSVYFFCMRLSSYTDDELRRYIVNEVAVEPQA